MDPRIVEAFRCAFGRQPARIARAPGRVNLIGEHVDYCGLAVLPMAIQLSVRIAFAPRDDARVRLVNADPARFGPREFGVGAGSAGAERGDWSVYAWAAARELSLRHGLARGIDACVLGDVPVAAGLSSSSALVVATTLALLDANAIEVQRTLLMDLCARAERHVGIESGGMDQAVSLGGRAGHALRIDFDPVRTQVVPIPATWRFVVADSGVGAEKAGRARDAYNARVAECREALARARAHPASAGWPATWRELVARVPERSLLESGSRALGGVLARRFRHVVTEGFRVPRAVAALSRGDLAGFGRLMDLSHASLRDDHAVSCPELDACVLAARAAGAAGARLTGAGFGGCIVALAEEGAAPAVESALREHAGPNPTAGAVFTAVASDGAAVTPA